MGGARNNPIKRGLCKSIPTTASPASQPAQGTGLPPMFPVPPLHAPEARLASPRVYGQGSEMGWQVGQWEGMGDPIVLLRPSGFSWSVSFSDFNGGFRAILLSRATGLAPVL